MLRNTPTITDMETDLVETEAEIARLRARQMVLINELDRAQAHHSDRSRSILEWVQSHLDIDIDTARCLVYTSQRVARHRNLSFRLADGTDPP